MTRDEIMDLWVACGGEAEGPSYQTIRNIYERGRSSTCPCCGWNKAIDPPSGQEPPIVRGALDAQAEAERRAHAAYTNGVADERNASRELVAAVIAYDEAIESCANSPDRMASFCSAKGDDLDALYERMRAVARTMQGRPTE